MNLRRRDEAGLTVMPATLRSLSLPAIPSSTGEGRGSDWGEQGAGFGWCCHGPRVSPEEQQGVITPILNVCLGGGGKGNLGCSKEVSV